MTLLEKSRWIYSCEHVQTLLEEVYADKMFAAKGFTMSLEVAVIYSRDCLLDPLDLFSDSPLHPTIIQNRDRQDDSDLHR